MAAVLGHILPLVLVVWFSPMPVTAATLMLLSKRARSTATAYMIGWVTGITVYVVGFTLLGTWVAGAGLPSMPVIVGVVDILVALTMLVLAIVAWRDRPRAGHARKAPRWMGLIDRMTALPALGLGLVFSIFSPTHFAVIAAVGVDIAAGGLTIAEQIIAGALFVLLGTSSVTAPVIVALVAPGKAEAPLGRVRDWLAAHGDTTLTILFLVITADFAGKAITALT